LTLNCTSSVTFYFFNDPISGIAIAAAGTVGNVLMGVADYPIAVHNTMKNNRDPTLNSDTGGMDTLLSTKKGVPRIIGAGLKSPMSFTYNLARGFHNTPKLWKDETVRPAEMITGFGSGLKAAGIGLGYGLYDGISGLVTQPMNGAKQDGAVGFLKGFGKGIGGVVCKPAAGACGVPGYAFMGIYKEIQRQNGTENPDSRVALRLAQGDEAWKAATEKECRDIVIKWLTVKG